MTRRCTCQRATRAAGERQRVRQHETYASRHGEHMRFMVRNAGSVIIAAAIFWFTVFVMMHMVQPEVDPLRVPGSAYVLGQYGMWARVSYLAITAALLAAGVGITARLRKSRATSIALAAFRIGAAGALLAAIFPMDYPGPPKTPSGVLHAVGGGVGFLSWISGTVLFTAGIRKDPAWTRLSDAVGVLAAASVVGAAVLITSIAVLGFGGFAQRILLTLLFGWLIAVAMHMRRSTAGVVAESEDLT